MMKQAVTLAIFFIGLGLLSYGLFAFDWRLACVVFGFGLCWSALRNM